MGARQSDEGPVTGGIATAVPAPSAVRACHVVDQQWDTWDGALNDAEHCHDSAVYSSLAPNASTSR
jgi:hypothetical protein